MNTDQKQPWVKPETRVTSIKEIDTVAADAYVSGHRDESVRRMYGHHLSTFIAGANYKATQLKGIDPADIDLIENAVNHYWHYANNELGRKDLGDIEKRGLEKIRDRSKKFLNKFI